MSLVGEVLKRRLIPWMGGYLVTGFVVLEAADQMVGYDMVPEVVYRVTFTLYAWGVLVAMILAWYHGEKGPQKPERGEVTALTVIILGAVINSGFVAVRNRPVDLAEGLGGLDARRVAILYMEDASGAGDLGYVADGMTEALIERLGAVRELDVVSRNGVAQFQGSDIEYDSIARALQVGTLVDGTVQDVGDRIQVSVQMIDGLSGAAFDRTSLRLPKTEVIALQDSVAEEVSRFLRIRLGEEVRLRERRTGTASTEAWSLAQRAQSGGKPPTGDPVFSGVSPWRPAPSSRWRWATPRPPWGWIPAALAPWRSGVRPPTGAGSSGSRRTRWPEAINSRPPGPTWRTPFRPTPRWQAPTAPSPISITRWMTSRRPFWLPGRPTRRMRIWRWPTWSCAGCTTDPVPDRAWALRDTLTQLVPEEQREFRTKLGGLIVGGVLRRAQLADSAEVVLTSSRGDYLIDPEQELMGYEAAIRSSTGDVDGAIELLKRYVSANSEHRFDVGGNLHWFWRPVSDHPDFRTILGRD
jgi:TolB-like protein